jgi:hypothetical protein
MDPLGFGLENFDAIGAWRTVDGKAPIDASGTLPDGRSFRGPQELRAILRTEREPFTRAITGKLMTYALGRGLERSDRRELKKMAAAIAADGYRFSSVVLQIVNSRAFQMQRAEPKPAPAAEPVDTRTAERHPARPGPSAARAISGTPTQEPAR